MDEKVGVGRVRVEGLDVQLVRLIKLLLVVQHLRIKIQVQIHNY